VERRWDFNQEGMLCRKSMLMGEEGELANGGVKVAWVRCSLLARVWSSWWYSMFSVLRGSWPPAMTSRAEDFVRNSSDRKE